MRSTNPLIEEAVKAKKDWNEFFGVGFFWIVCILNFGLCMWFKFEKIFSWKFRYNSVGSQFVALTQKSWVISPMSSIQ